MSESSLRHEIEGGPYSEDIFTPLSAEEKTRLLEALDAAGVPYARDRLHAQFGRQTLRWILEELDKPD